MFAASALCHGAGGTVPGVFRQIVRELAANARRSAVLNISMDNMDSTVGPLNPCPQPHLGFGAITPQV